MKKLTLILILLMSVTAIGQTTYRSYATESLTIDATAGGVAFTALKINPVTANTTLRATLVDFRVECSAASPCPIRFTVDGTTVTSSVGYLLNEGDNISIYTYTNISNFHAIRTGANSAVIQPIYSRQGQ